MEQAMHNNAHLPKIQSALGPLSRASLKLGAGSELDRAVSNLLQMPGPETRDALFHALNEKHTRGEALPVSTQGLATIRKRLEQRFALLDQESKELVQRIRIIEDLPARAALLVNLGKKIWGPIGGMENYDSGVRAEDLKQHQGYFAKFVELYQGMEAIKDGYRYIAASVLGNGPSDKIGKAEADKIPGFSKKRDGSEAFYGLLSEREKIEVLRQSIVSGKSRSAQSNEWHYDCLNYMTPSNARRKSLLKEALSDPDTAKKVDKLLPELRSLALNAGEYVDEIRKQLKDRDLRAALWLELAASLRSYRGSWEGAQRISSKDRTLFFELRDRYLARRDKADAVFSQVARIRAVLDKGDPYQSAPAQDPVMKKAEKAWNEDNVLAGILTSAERAAFLRERISALLKDESYEGGRELSELLSLAALGGAERKQLIESLFSKRFLEKTTEELKEKVAACKSSAKGYSEYMEGVTKQLDEFASIFPEGRESWGFIHGVDHEDLISERNFANECGKRNEATNAALMRLRAITGGENDS